MSYIDSKNCSEHLMTNRMGLDRAPVEFQKLVFFETPYSYIVNNDLINFSQFQAARQEGVQEPLEANFEAPHLHVPCRLLHLWLCVGLP